jgi:hypothetical protein
MQQSAYESTTEGTKHCYGVIKVEQPIHLTSSSGLDIAALPMSPDTGCSDVIGSGFFPRCHGHVWTGVFDLMYVDVFFTHG